MNIRWLFNTRAEASTILIRLSIGLVVFVPEGVQKLIFPGILGAGRFARIGIPFPHVMGPFVGTVEIVCGVLIMVGLCTRLATVPLIIVMIVAIISTKIPILVGHDFGPFHLAADMKRVGFWSAQHEARADLTMLLGCAYLLLAGAGKWSADAALGGGKMEFGRSKLATEAQNGGAFSV